MTGYAAPIRRIDTARGHHYQDANGRRVPGVTSILSDGIPKPALINWAANATADAAINRWDELAELPPAQRLAALKSARYDDKDRAANRGTEVHRHAEALVHGKTVQVPDEVVGHVEAYARFLDEHNVTPVHVEFSIASYGYGYAGTGDLICELDVDGDRVTAMVDLKTNRSGIFGETALQLAAYRYADVIITGRGTVQEEQPMSAVHACYAVHVRGDGYSLIPVDTSPDVHRAFLYAAQVAAWVKRSKDLVGPSIPPPTASTYRLTREQDTP